ncbi:soma ferritin [Bactrocera neohumeralis]|uniref:soma ferritin n=1 Tax=Bactrocera tryoni TaxID=59916 RepID=UPI001A95BED2|nr:soma ferritin [Bactrocera tryoni]XP_039970430.1 soma ferritin [Bactrocera tryoni]XP_050316568.1 soma ferritin [Bactrocera neohumeralis]XP_050316569.1 soma ferritin [Bactrocera neohumeralis]
MKPFTALTLFAGIIALASAENYACHSNVTYGCSNSVSTPVVCHSRYGGIENVESTIQSYINLNLHKSYQYLLLSSFYNSYQKNRPGFNKLYRDLSDRSFDDAIDLIKHVTRRGGQVDFRAISQHPNSIAQSKLKLEEDELHSLGIALDIEKTLTADAGHVHYQSTHGRPHDPQTAHYIEEKFLHKQADSVRKVSGLVNDLSKIMNQPDPSLGIYLFDQYLEKQ